MDDGGNHHKSTIDFQCWEGWIIRRKLDSGKEPSIHALLAKKYSELSELHKKLVVE